PELARAYRQHEPGVRIDIEALGSSTGFVGLLDGSADIGASSRPVTASELSQAERLDIVLHELLVGWDGIAVIVHRNTEITALSIPALRRIYRERDAELVSFGGPPGEIHVVTRPPESGTHAFFAERVLEGGAERQDAIAIEHSDEVVRFVASDTH